MIRITSQKKSKWTVITRIGYQVIRTVIPELDFIRRSSPSMFLTALVSSSSKRSLKFVINMSQDMLNIL